MLVELKTKIDAEGISALIEFIRGYDIRSRLASMDYVWQEFYTKMQDYKTMIQKTGWEEKSAQYDAFMHYAASISDEIAKVCGARKFSEEKNLLNKALKAVSDYFGIIWTPKLKRNVSIALGIVPAALVLLLGQPLWLLIPAVIFSITLVMSINKSNVKIAMAGISASGIFMVFKMLGGLLNIDKIMQLSTKATELFSDNPVLLAIVGVVAVSAIIISISLSPYLKKIEADKSSHQANALFVLDYKVKGLWKLLTKHWVQQLFGLTNKLLPMLAGVGITTMAGTGILKLAGLPMTESLGIALLGAVALASVLGLATRLITIRLNREILETAPPLVMKQHQRFFQGFIKGFIGIAGLALIIQFTGIPVMVSALLVAGVAGIIGIGTRISSKADTKMADKGMERWGMAASAVGFGIVMTLISLVPAIADSMWAVGFISAILFGASGVTQVIANKILTKKNILVQAYIFGEKDKAKTGFKFIFRQMLFNPVAFGQAIIGLIGVPSALFMGIKVVGGAIVGLAILKGIIFIAAAAGAVFVISVIIRVISKSIADSKANSALDKLKKTGRWNSIDVNVMQDILEKGLRKEDIKALAKENDAPNAVMLGILKFINSSRAPDTKFGKYLPRDVKFIIQEALLELQYNGVLIESDRKDIEAVLFSIFTNSNLTATLPDRIKHFFKDPEKLLELSSMATSLSMAVPATILTAHKQQMRISATQEIFSKMEMDDERLKEASDLIFKPAKTEEKETAGPAKEKISGFMANFLSSRIRKGIDTVLTAVSLLNEAPATLIAQTKDRKEDIQSEQLTENTVVPGNVEIAGAGAGAPPPIAAQQMLWKTQEAIGFLGNLKQTLDLGRSQNKALDLNDIEVPSMLSDAVEDKAKLIDLLKIINEEKAQGWDFRLEALLVMRKAKDADALMSNLKAISKEALPEADIARSLLESMEIQVPERAEPVMSPRLSRTFGEEASQLISWVNHNSIYHNLPLSFEVLSDKVWTMTENVDQNMILKQGQVIYDAALGQILWAHTGDFARADEQTNMLWRGSLGDFQDLRAWNDGSRYHPFIYNPD
ncbi:MAG: hypothetical protein WC394_04775, partial [Candidatus Omnitrophota bacterium]